MRPLEGLAARMRVEALIKGCISRRYTDPLRIMEVVL